jgi:hypothetical protein
MTIQPTIPTPPAIGLALIYNPVLGRFVWRERSEALRHLCANCWERRATVVHHNWALCRRCSKS